MAEHLALPPKQRFTALPQLYHVRLRKGVQGPGERGLLGKPLPPPGVGQRRIGAQAGVDLHDGPTAGQNTDDHVEQLRGWGVVDGFEGQV